MSIKLLTAPLIGAAAGYALSLISQSSGTT